MRRRFSDEFKANAVELARSGGAPIVQVARDLGVAEVSLRRWMRASDVENGVRDGVTKAESVELRELKKRNRLLEQEIEVLRRAAAYFARENVLPK